MEDFNLRKYLKENKLLKETQLNLFRKLAPGLRRELDSEYYNDYELSQHPEKKEKFYDLLITYVPDRKFNAFKNAAAELFGFDYVGTGSNDGEMLEYFYNLVQDSLEDTLIKEESRMSTIKPGDKFQEEKGEIYTVKQVRGNQVDFSYDDGMSFGDDTSGGEATFPDDFPNVDFFDFFTPVN